MKNLLLIFLISTMSMGLVYAKPNLTLVRHADNNSMIYIYEVKTIDELNKINRENVLNVECKSNQIFYHTQVFNSVMVKYWTKNIKSKIFTIKNSDCLQVKKINS